ncbi:MAG: hypothetical protein ACLRZH_03900 [Ruthenibacterium lactatiformans]
MAQIKPTLRKKRQGGALAHPRITGYLVGTLDRFNGAKRAEETTV